MRDATIKQYIKLINAYHNALNDPKILLAINNGKRKHVLSALSHLARYLGVYDVWLNTKHRYGIKWNNHAKFSISYSIDDMIAYIKQLKDLIPKKYYHTFLYGSLIGLRASEICYSIRLLKQGVDDYYDASQGLLLHYLYPNLFIRRTKNAYISIVNDDIVALALSAEDNYNKIRKYMQRHGMDTKLRYARKIYATWLRDKGINSDIIDLLQGRVNASIFAKHYYKPSLAYYRSKVLDAIIDLKSILE